MQLHGVVFYRLHFHFFGAVRIEQEKRESVIESVYQIVVYFSHVSYPGIELTPLL